MADPASIAALLARLEENSRARPDRVLRLTGTLPASESPGGEEPFELLIFRGFSSSITHPTAFDPDRPALPETARIAAAELLAGPLNPADERRLAGPLPAEAFLVARAWEGLPGS
jgi:hypothetical protein